MAAGIALRNAARTVINQVGNTVTLTAQSSASNVRGDITWTTGSASNVTAATTNTIKTKFMKQIAGDIKAGDLIVYIKDTDTILDSYKVTYQSIDYKIDELKPIYVENVLVVNVATCFKNLD